MHAQPPATEPESGISCSSAAADGQAVHAASSGDQQASAPAAAPASQSSGEGTGPGLAEEASGSSTDPPTLTDGAEGPESRAASSTCHSPAAERAGVRGPASRSAGCASLAGRAEEEGPCMPEKADALVLDLFDHRCALARIRKNVNLFSLSF